MTLKDTFIGSLRPQCSGRASLGEQNPVLLHLLQISSCSFFSEKMMHNARASSFQNQE